MDLPKNRISIASETAETQILVATQLRIAAHHSATTAFSIRSIYFSIVITLDFCFVVTALRAPRIPRRLLLLPRYGRTWVVAPRLSL